MKALLLPFSERRRLHDRAERARKARWGGEVCGAVVADEIGRCELWFMKNESDRPGHFQILKEELRQVRAAVGRQEKRLIGIFHSHVMSGAVPGAGDRRGIPLRYRQLIYAVLDREIALWRVSRVGNKRVATQLPLTLETRSGGRVMTRRQRMRRMVGCLALVGLGSMACAKQVTATPDVIEARLHPNPAIPLQPVLVGGREGVIFPEARAREVWWEGSASAYWTPSEQDVERLERQLKPYLEHLLSSAESRPGSDADYAATQLSKILEHYGGYRRQYVGIVVGKSKRILINSFPAPGSDGRDDHEYWTRKFVIVNDGGYRYWNVQYDVDRDKFLEFESNGYA